MSKTPKFEKRHFEYLALIIKEIETMNEENIPNFKSAVINTIIVRLKDVAHPCYLADAKMAMIS